MHKLKLLPNTPDANKPGRVMHWLAAALLPLLALALTAGAPGLPAADFVPDQVLVKMEAGAPVGTALQALGPRVASVVGNLPALGVSVLAVPEGTVLEAAERLNATPGVEWAEPNYLAWAVKVIPDDPEWANQWGLEAIRAPQGWELAKGSSSVTIAIVDSGVDLLHPDLADKIVPGRDFVNGDSDPQDDYGHGTHVAGIAAASTNNGIGVAGTSWRARVMPVKVLNAVGVGSYSDVASGILWAVDHGAQVINLSLGGSTPSSVLEGAVYYAHTNGVVLVAAAGNSGSGSILYPARLPDVIAVGATDSADTRAAFSNYGPELSVMAPGVSILSTGLGGAYVYDSGTSMSTPFVAGLAAILIGEVPSASPNKIRRLIESTALDLGEPGRDDFTGRGLIQVDAAIAKAISLPPVIETPEPTASAPVPTAPATPDPGLAYAQEVRISKTASARTVLPGDTVIWTIEVWNESGSPSGAVVIEDAVPEGLEVIDTSASKGVAEVIGSAVRVTVGALLPGESAAVTIETAVSPQAAAGELCNTARAGSVEAVACVEVFPAELPATGGAGARFSWQTALLVAAGALSGGLGVWRLTARLVKRDAPQSK